MLGFVFTGQGSQKVGMLAEWYAQSNIVKQTFEEASNALGFNVWSITQDASQLNLTANAQPVILTASIALWREWLNLNQMSQQSDFLGANYPTFLAGHSLGEYSALVAGESLAFSDAVRLVHLRGSLMQQAVPEGTGAMCAILGLDDATVIKECLTIQKNSQEIVSPANFNATGQVVISGTKQGVQLAITQFKDLGAKAIILPVSVPSHCELMTHASEQLADALQQIKLELPKIPVIHNVGAIQASSVSQLKELLVEQLYSPVEWTRTMLYLKDCGVTRLVECGFGNSLTGLQKRIAPTVSCSNIDTPEKMAQTISTITEAL